VGISGLTVQTRSRCSITFEGPCAVLGYLFGAYNRIVNIVAMSFHVVSITQKRCVPSSSFMAVSAFQMVVGTAMF
jgi:hypothetical protein